MDDKEISITLKVSQWNTVMMALGEMPLKNGIEVFSAIRAQADSQINATIEPPQNPS